MDAHLQDLWRRHHHDPEARAALCRALTRVGDQAGLCELGEHRP